MLKTTAELLNMMLDQINQSLMEEKLKDIPEIVRLCKETIFYTRVHQGSQLNDDTWAVLVLSRDDVDVDPQVSSEYTDSDMRLIADRIGNSDAVMDDYWVAISCAKDELAEREDE